MLCNYAAHKAASVKVHLHTAINQANFIPWGMLSTYDLGNKMHL